MKEKDNIKLDTDKKTRAAADEKNKRRKALIKFGSMTVLAAVVIIFATIAWFAMNDDVTADGMSVTVEGSPFELAAAGSSGLYDDFIDEVAPGYSADSSTGSSQSIKWQLVASESEIKNIYTENGTPDMAEITRSDSDKYGLKPGASGTLRFYVIPTTNEAVDVTFKLDITGYKATYQNVTNLKTDDPMTQVTDTTVKNFLNAHILFFYEDPENNKHFITDDGFQISNISKRTLVTIYWVWPATLQELLDANIDTLNDTEASKEIRRYFFESPEHFLKSTGEVSFSDFKVDSGTVAERETLIETNITEYLSGRDYSQYSTMYNEADQSVGDNVNYILVNLTAGM
ncbi:MAG: hypothetical protein IJ571_02300 [Ruminococcus sp.]|nr:hypothetical protein [Ruminococcus sp.]